MNHLRERYWEERVGARLSNAGAIWLSGGFHVDLGRSGVGRARHQPGDAFRYSVSVDLSGTHTNMEWYEVTEVFLTTEARDVTSFHRRVNGLTTDDRFDPATFLRSVVRRRPGRAQQRDAADKVREEVERKLTKPTYSPVLESYGYGTLVVGLPLWFATPPLDPLRPENAIDDFMTRILLGLEDLEKKHLRGKACPFGRVVVVWEPTRTAMREWVSQAKQGV